MVTVVVFEFGVMRCQPLRRALTYQNAIFFTKSMVYVLLVSNRYRRKR
ncbi:acetyltransferase [Vibrio paracholerae]|uniref:Acetyltransferase n=1 Tax=Vibrio paracholerae TaxID=650003 RepID=A0ABX9FG07_9VIBR|nr:acetyltransferase [Vibrio paracholerae]